LFTQNSDAMAKTHKKKDDSHSQSTQSHALAGRKTLYTLENQEGEVIALDNANFGIRTEGTYTVLFPVNLSPSLKKEGIKIKFSGQVKETDLTEFWAAQPVLLTKVEN